MTLSQLILLASPHGSCCEPPRRPSSHPCTKKYIRRPFGTTDIFGGQGWSARDCHGGGSLFLVCLQSLGGEHSFSALISIVVNASLVIASAWLLLRTTAAVLISPLHKKIYPPSLWDNGYIWWAGIILKRDPRHKFSLHIKDLIFCFFTDFVYR